MSDDKPLGKMSSKDIVIRIMYLITQEGVSKKTLRKIFDYVERVLLEQDDFGAG